MAAPARSRTPVHRRSPDGEDLHQLGDGCACSGGGAEDADGDRKGFGGGRSAKEGADLGDLGEGLSHGVGSLRGHRTRWMIEVHAGVFVGNPSRRIRDRLWDPLANRIDDGQAILVEQSSNEQGWAVRTASKDRRQPVDFDGLILSARRRNQPK
ncbi:type I-E CRISPR-associated endoribonuclease Cas2e [Actinomadura sp. 6N118]|uniref:type I-E CRISPR-associated endoribonuclease Cas2e n=1 Tax=Actinomadura sp. 6N118 TaxID=3375151 RepID=UPI00379788EB